jgi:hypothetical protein
MGLASLASYDFGSRRTFPTGVTLISKRITPQYLRLSQASKARFGLQVLRVHGHSYGAIK